MAKPSTVRLYRTFVKGLITEASPLTFPEEASIDEDNCILSRKGNRSRRLGIDYEDGFALSTFDISDPNMVFKEYRWESVSNKSNINFLVQQIGLTLYFYDISGSTISTNRKNFTLDLNGFSVSGTAANLMREISFASGYGYLFCVGETFEPFIVTYNEDDDNITSERIYIQIRDFEGLEDGLANDEEPTTITPEHRYNLMNQGWVSAKNNNTGVQAYYYTPNGGRKSYRAPTAEPIDFYYKILHRYPANNKQWWTAKASSDGNGYKFGEFNPTLLEKFYTGNTPAPKGHFVIDAFRKDRSEASGIPNLSSDIKLTRPGCVGFFSGRTWYGHESAVYYSQILTSKDKAGFCYQEADPTSESISDLIATDGGIVSIPEMAKAVALVPAGTGILCFATNGVWFISGSDKGFTATDLTVQRVHPIGTDSPNSVVEANGQIFWFSKVGIMGMAQKMGMFGSVDGVFEKTNISEETIQQFYTNNIPDASRPYVKATYDPASNTVQWLFKTSDIGSPYIYNRMLNFDLTTQAFYPWTISGAEGESPMIIGSVITPRINRIETELEVVSDGVQVVNGADNVIFNTFVLTIKNTFAKYSILVPVSGGYKVTFGTFSNTEFADWKTFDGTGLAFNSFVETGYELLEDAMRDKQTTYVTTFFRRTESSYVPEDDTFVLDRPSSCFFQTKWDWASSSNSNRWSTKVQAYRHQRIPGFSEADLGFDTGFAVVATKHKVRGHGRAIQFRFENNEIGKDFDLLGWSVAYTGNANP